MPTSEASLIATASLLVQERLMSIVFTTAGEAFLLETMLGQNQDISLSIGLYVTPSGEITSSDAITDVTPLGVAGYLPKALNQPWTIPPSSPVKATYPTIQFPKFSVPSGNLTVGGYYVYDNDTEMLLFGDTLSSTYKITTTPLAPPPINIIITFSSFGKPSPALGNGETDGKGELNPRLQLPLPGR
jgi:hypothetical protein